MKRSRWIYCLVILTFGPSDAWAQVRYAVTDLTEIWNNSFAQPEMVTRWFASSINDRGQVAGTAETTDNSVFACAWDAKSGLRDLSNLGLPTGASCINNRGQVAVDFSPYLWDLNAELQPIDACVSPSGINDAGQVVGLHWPDNNNSHAFLWDNGVMKDLGNLGSETAGACAINNLGQIVGFSDMPTSSHAFLWDCTNGMQDLGLAVAWDINDLGQIAGSMPSEDGECHACLWENGVIRNIDTLGAPRSSSDAINNLGQVVGSFQVPEGTYAFLWDSTSTMQQLNDLIAAGSVWDIKEAYDINDSGWIVATAMKSLTGGRRQACAVLLMPVPEPTCAALAIGAATTLIVMFFRSIRKEKQQ